MKRIYNDIPLESILFGVAGNQRIIVRNWENEHAMHFRDTWGNGKYEVMYEGEARGCHGYQYSKMKYSKYYGMTVLEDGTLAFDVCTAFEQY